MLNNPEIRDLGIKIVMKAAKDAAGIGTEPVSKKAGPATRAIYAMKDFIQGTWWVVVFFTLGMGIVLILLFIFYMSARKVLGV